MNKTGKRIFLFLGGILLFIFGLGGNHTVLGAPKKPASPAAELIQIEDQSLPDRLRVLVHTTRPVTPKHFILTNPSRLVLDLSPLILGKDNPLKIKDPSLIEDLKFIKNKKTIRITFPLNRFPSYQVFPKTGKPFTLGIDFLKPRPSISQVTPQKKKEIDLPPKTLEEFTKEKTLQGNEVKKQLDDAQKQRFQFDFYMENLHNVLRTISDIGGVNIVVGDDVKEKKVTLTLKNVTWKEALDAILESVNLVKIEQSSNTFLIITRENQGKKEDEERKNKAAKIKEEQEELKTEIERQRSGKVLYQTKTFQIKNVDVKVVEDLIMGTLERQRRVMTQPVIQGAPQSGTPTVVTDTSRFIGTTLNIVSVPHTNTLVARGSERDIDYVTDLVNSIDQPMSQVMIEARIIEANANFTRDIGLRWGGTYPFANASGPFAGTIRGADAGATSTSPTNNYAVNLPLAATSTAFGGLGFTFATTNFNLDVRIQAMEKAGQGKTLASPKILTLDSKKAVIKQGQSIPVTTRTELGTFSTTYRDAALTLEVTPHILSGGKKMRIELKITKNEPDFSKTDTLGNYTINTKEASTEMVINDGNTVVLGGIISKQESFSENKIPGLGDIPVLGWLFKTRYKSYTDTELLIFLTPRIMKSSLKDRFGGEN